MVASESWPYRSPVLKLVWFFRRSRDQWKDKCKAAKRENKSLKTRLAKMRESRDRWKAKAQEVSTAMPVGCPSPGEDKNHAAGGPGGGSHRGA